MLKKLFNLTFFPDHVPQPKHMIYPALMMAAGWKVLIEYQWMGFGLTFIIIGIFFAVAVIIGVGWRGPIEYWKQIEETLRVMIKIKDPAVWVSMGYKSVPSTIVIEERKSDEKGNFLGFSYKRPEIISPVAANTIANKVLLSKNIDFTQAKYGSIISNFRKAQKELIELGYIAPKNKKNVRSGYRFTKKGIDFCYQYADEAIRLQLRKENVNAS